MPSRVIREGLLDSERIAAIHDKTFRLYVSLLLTADDFGLVDVSFGAVRAANGMQEWPRDMVSKMLLELVDAGLILPYEAEGKQYAAICRWQSRVNCVRPKYPPPTFGMGHMLRPYQYKNDHVHKSVSSYFKHLPSDGVPPVCHQRATSGTKGVKGKGERINTKVEIKDISTLSSSVDDDADLAVAVSKKTAYRLPDCPYQALVDAYHHLLPALPRVEVVSEQRKRHLQARWRQVCADEKLDRAAGVQWFRDFFEHVGKSAFLTGKVRPTDGRKPFFASLDWLMGAEKFVQVYEGRYHR